MDESSHVVEATKLWVTLTPAIIGLVGVLVGAVISTGANYWLAVRKENAEASKDTLARTIELKTAARLIGHEFYAGRAVTKILVEQKRWVTAEVKLPLVAWEGDKGILARELSLEDWNAVRIGALAVGHIESLRPVPHTRDILNDSISESAMPIFKDINAAVDALKPYMADSSRLFQ
jgi:hypothetical protein